MSDALDAASPIELHGHTWHPWTRKELADLTAKIDCSERVRLTLSVSAVLLWCNSVNGCVPALAVSGRCSEGDVESKVPMTELEDLVARLVNRCYGEADTEEVDEDVEASADPLALANGGS